MTELPILTTPSMNVKSLRDICCESLQNNIENLRKQLSYEQLTALQCAILTKNVTVDLLVKFIGKKQLDELKLPLVDDLLQLLYEYGL